MQPSLVIPVERPLRRVSSVRSTGEAQQVACSSGDCFSVVIDRGDCKLDKANNPLYLSPQGVRAGEMGLGIGSINESDHGNESNGLGHRRNYSGEQGVRKNRAIVSYCLGGILSLFLFVQIVTGGFGLLSSGPSALCGVKQMQPAFLGEKNQILEEQLSRVGHWKPVMIPVKEDVLSDTLRSTQQSLKDTTVRPSLYTARDEGQVNNRPREKDGLKEYMYNDKTNDLHQKQKGGVYDEQTRDLEQRGFSKEQSIRDEHPQSAQLVVRPSDSGGQSSTTTTTREMVQDESSSSIPDSTTVIQASYVRREIQRDSTRNKVQTSNVSTSVTEKQQQQQQSTNLVHIEAKPQEDSWFRQPAYSYQQCVDEGPNHRRPSEATNGYLLTFANGGLNQMRTAICDMVAVARMMNATLVIPELDHTSYWADPSDFGDVFDSQKFIDLLKDDVKVVRELPDEMQSVPVYELAPKSWSEAAYYEETVAPLLKQHKVVRFILTDSRLANNRLPEEIQRLRCKANYRALKFEPSIEELGQKIISRLRAKGPYIAMHLRFEKDMLAFSGCTFGLSAEEAEELRVIRYNVSRWKEKEIDPVSRRAEGGCPLTPLEIGLMLRAMGYPKKTMIYVASGQIYGGEERMKTFTNLFPNVVTKESIATAEEMQRFSDYQNRMAAIDYMVAVDADVFVPSYEGNMARAVQGHRRFNGHKITLIPDRVELVKLLDQYQNGEINWPTLQKAVVRTHVKRQGSPHSRKPLSPSRAKLEENFYANPLPGCICEVGSSAQ